MLRRGWHLLVFGSFLFLSHWEICCKCAPKIVACLLFFFWFVFATNFLLCTNEKASQKGKIYLESSWFSRTFFGLPPFSPKKKSVNMYESSGPISGHWTVHLLLDACPIWFNFRGGFLYYCQLYNPRKFMWKW